MQRVQQGGHVRGIGDDLGASALDELMRTRTRRRRDRARDRADGAAVPVRFCRHQQRSRPEARLRDHRRARQRTQQTGAGHEPPPGRRRPRRSLAGQHPQITDPGQQIRVAARIRAVNAAGQHRDRAPACGQRSAVCCGVDAIGATGDALVELGQIEKGISKYIEAAEYADNSFNTPLYLMKAGELYESSGKYPDALKVYERIKKEYPTSTEGSSIDKYIARVKILSKQ